MAKSAKKNTIDASAIKSFFVRFHAIIFFVAVVGSLSAAVYILNETIALSDKPTDYVPPTASSTFDEATIERVRKLTPSTQAPEPLEIPSGRIDPFRQ